MVVYGLKVDGDFSSFGSHIFGRKGREGPLGDCMKDITQQEKMLTWPKVNPKIRAIKLTECPDSPPHNSFKYLYPERRH